MYCDQYKQFADKLSFISKFKKCDPFFGHNLTINIVECICATFEAASEQTDMDKKLSGKVAVITASSEGIGFAIAKRLAQDGAQVVVSSRKQGNVDKAVDNLRALNLSVTGIVCHVGKPGETERLLQKVVERFGGLDILVSNAAVNPGFGPILDITEDVWDKIFEVNLKSAFFLCKEAIPLMATRGGGSIILVSSLGAYNIWKYLGPYSISKAALLAMVKALAPQCGEMNIRVNAIAPGLINTNFSGVIRSEKYVTTSTIMQRLPLGRFGEPNDCAGATSFLASDESAYITGETIVIGGGIQTRL